MILSKIWPARRVIVVTQKSRSSLKASACGLITQDYLAIGDTKTRGVVFRAGVYRGLGRRVQEPRRSILFRRHRHFGADGENRRHGRFAKAFSQPMLYLCERGRARELLALYKYNDGHPASQRTKATSVNGRIHPRNNRQALLTHSLWIPRSPLSVIGNSGRGKVAYGASRRPRPNHGKARWEILLADVHLSAQLGDGEGARLSQGGLDGKMGTVGRADTRLF